MHNAFCRSSCRRNLLFWTESNGICQRQKDDITQWCDSQIIRSLSSKRKLKLFCNLFFMCAWDQNRRLQKMNQIWFLTYKWKCVHGKLVCQKRLNWLNLESSSCHYMPTSNVAASKIEQCSISPQTENSWICWLFLRKDASKSFHRKNEMHERHSSWQYMLASNVRCFKNCSILAYY